MSASSDTKKSWTCHRKVHVLCSDLKHFVRIAQGTKFRFFLFRLLRVMHDIFQIPFRFIDFFIVCVQKGGSCRSALAWVLRPTWTYLVTWRRRKGNVTRIVTAWSRYCVLRHILFVIFSRSRCFFYLLLQVARLFYLLRKCVCVID